MSYTFLQEQGAESSAECFSDIPAYVLSNLNLTVAKSSSNDNGTESYQGSLSGTMSEPLTGHRGEIQLTFYAEDSPAKTLAPQATGQDSMARKAGYGQSSQEYWAKYDPGSHSLKTRQWLLFEDSTECCVTLPNWGTMRGGACFPLVPLVYHTHGNACSVWATPMTHGNAGTFNTHKLAALGVNRHWWNPNHQEWLMNWPSGWSAITPLATDKFRQWFASHGNT